MIVSRCRVGGLCQGWSLLARTACSLSSRPLSDSKRVSARSIFASSHLVLSPRSGRFEGRSQNRPTLPCLNALRGRYAAPQGEVGEKAASILQERSSASAPSHVRANVAI